MSLKAYKVWDNRSLEPSSTVVFAENVRAAKKIARLTDACEDADYINIRVQRFPQMDRHYRGKKEIDWYDMEDRKALVYLGWMCLETSYECDACPVKNICGQWDEEEESYETD